ncbi:MAG TPA: hypothetical protein VGD89_15880 [Flavipsychrobacter sp.]
MKRLIPIVAIVLALLTGCQSVNEKTKENISFYEVPLVCGAAPDIGCGSRIKPLFVATEKEKAVKESWTNRQGTVIAIVWNNTTDEQRIKELFIKNDIKAERISDTSTLKELNASFRDKGKWYKGMDVDQLSIEEAGVIASETTGFALEEGFIDSAEATTIKNDIENYFKTELVQVRTLDNLTSDSTQERWRKDAYNIFVNHVGKEKAEKIAHAYEKKLSEIESCE